MDSRLSNLVNCVNAVEDCQVFLGIIRPLLGTGILEPDGRSITAQEFDRAIKIGMPRFVLADYRVEFAHKFLKLMGQDLTAIPNYKEREVKRDVSFVDLIRKALYGVEIRESKLVNAIVDCVDSKKLRSIITYNYDDILERELIKRKVSFFSVDGRNRPTAYQFPVFHVHGFIPSEEDKSYDMNVVLSEDEYHALYNNAFHWSNIEQVHAMVQTTCFFIGLSMKDPNLRRLLDIAQQRGSGNPSHYAFLRRGEYKQPQKAERIFYEMGVNVIWYERHNQLPKLIRAITENIK